MSKHVLAKVQTPIQMPNQSLGAGKKNEGETTQGKMTQGRNDPKPPDHQLYAHPTESLGLAPTMTNNMTKVRKRP